MDGAIGWDETEWESQGRSNSKKLLSHIDNKR